MKAQNEGLLISGALSQVHSFLNVCVIFAIFSNLKQFGIPESENESKNDSVVNVTLFNCE